MCHDPFDPQHWRWRTSNNSTKLDIHYVVVVCVCLGLTSFSTNISRQCLVATGSSMLTFIMLPHRGIKSQTLYLIPSQSHNTDSPSPTPKILVPSGEQLVTLSSTWDGTRCLPISERTLYILRYRGRYVDVHVVLSTCNMNLFGHDECSISWTF